MRSLALSIILSLSYSLGGMETNPKYDLVVKVIRTAKDFSGISGVTSIIKSYPDIYCHIPHKHPLGTQPYRLASSFGYRLHPIDKIRKLHAGVDFASEYANKVYATAKGEVIFSGVKSGYGKLVIIKHKYGFETYYAHLTYLYSKVGELVKSGSVVGFVGSTGQSTGNHLHYEIRKNGHPINPTPFLGW